MADTQRDATSSRRNRHVMEGFHKWWARVSAGGASWMNHYDSATSAWRAAVQYERRKAKARSK